LAGLKANIDNLKWMTGQNDDFSKKLFGEQNLEQNGMWNTLNLKGDTALASLQFLPPLDIDAKKNNQKHLLKRCRVLFHTNHLAVIVALFL